MSMIDRQIPSRKLRNLTGICYRKPCKHIHTKRSREASRKITNFYR